MPDYLHALPAGYRLDEYELVRVLGSGGFGITYLGYDHHLDKAVAIKEYLPNDLAVRAANQSVLPKSTDDKADYEWGLARFLTEAQTLARFDHRHIIKVYRFFRAHGTGYIVMEYAEGETLSEVLQRKGTLTETELQALLLPILDGLAVVHEADVLHRDIKPGNIVIRDDGSPVLIDFGSARQAVAGKSRSVTAIVTPGYAPIEQYSAKGHQGAWTDIYALAAVCYRCLTGEPPDDATERLRDDPLIPAIQRCQGKASAALLNAIDRALRVEEGERPQSVAAWREMLAEDGNSEQHTPKPAYKPETQSAEGLTAQRVGMGRLGRALVAAIVVLLGAILWQGWNFYRGAPKEVIGETAAVAEQQADTLASSQAGNEAETVGAATGQPLTEPATLALVEKEDEVTRLLAAAERDLAARRLTSPTGNNAWEKYQRVLELSPANPEAMVGMERVASAKRAQQHKAEQAARRAVAEQSSGEMVSIPGGTFLMGDLSGTGDNVEKLVRSVTVPAFKLGKHEVTVSQFRAFVEATEYSTGVEQNAGGEAGCVSLRADGNWVLVPGRSWRKPGYLVEDEDNQPVVCVSWNDTQAFIQWLNDETGGNYRLPTEAEWEYAARAGTTTKYSWGDDIGSNRANCHNDVCGDSYSYTAPVGSFPANPWGLHDMHGNVWERVQDCWNISYEGAPTDGSAWTDGDCSQSVFRGGSWAYNARGLRSASRGGLGRAARYNGFGFRLAQDK